MKKTVLLVIIFLFSILPVAADPDFFVAVTPVKDNIHFNESAEFVFTISNNRNFDVEYTFKTPQLVYWDILAKPLYDYPNVNIEANQSKDIHLFFNPISSGLGTGTKRLTLEVMSDKGVKATQDITIFIIPEGTSFGQYYPRVVIEGMEIPQNIDPQDELVLWFRLVNKNSLDLKNVTLAVSSRLIEETRATFQMPPYNESLIKLVPKLNASAEAGSDTVRMSIIVNDDIIKEYNREVNITKIDIPYTAEENITKSFLRTDFTYEVLNPSNIHKNETYYLPTSYIDRIFSWTTPKAYISKEQGHNYAWDLALAPGETATISLVRSYRSLLYIAILLVLFLIVYYVFKPDLVINKSATRVTSKKGGFSESTIRLNIRNISKYRLEDVGVNETIPNIAEYVPEEVLGVVTPSSVKRFELKGTKLHWHFDELAPQEERILTYKMKTKLDVVGRFKLETTVAEYSKKGKKKMSFSNTVYLSENGQG